jgi:hypothetical protein
LNVSPLYINEDNAIRWDAAKRAAAGTYINSGTGTWELLDADLNLLVSGSLSYVSSSNGRWQGTIDKTDVDDLVEGAVYYVDLTLTDGSGADGFRRIECVAQYHGAV